jgi:RNA polymerase sigma-70 factor (ECF subfamily)
MGMKNNIIRLNETELIKIINRIISEQTLMSQDELELVELLKMGDRRAQTEFFNQFYKRIKSFIKSKTQKFDDDDIDLIASKSLEKAIKHIDKFQGKGSLSSWIIKIAYNTMLDKVRELEQDKFKSTRHIDPTQISQSDRYYDSPIYNDVKKTFEDFLKTLKEKEKDIMVLRAQGTPNKEIAEIVGTSEGTIKWYISTLAKRFKDYMEKNS